MWTERVLHARLSLPYRQVKLSLIVKFCLLGKAGKLNFTASLRRATALCFSQLHFRSGENFTKNNQSKNQRPNFTPFILALIFILLILTSYVLINSLSYGVIHGNCYEDKPAGMPPRIEHTEEAVEECREDGISKLG